MKKSLRFNSLFRAFIFIQLSIALGACTNVKPVSNSQNNQSPSGTQSALGTSSTLTTVCPSGYVSVPHDPNNFYTTSDFCVAKYIASQGSDGGASSVPNEVPWTNIARDDARTACQANGAGYDLISNAEWQTVAQNLELVGANWSSGIVGTGAMNQGISDGYSGSSSSLISSLNPNTGFPASADDTQGCYLTDAYNPNACIASGTWTPNAYSNQRRTFTLSTGSIVWDMAGNVWQFVKDDNTNAFTMHDFISNLILQPSPVIGMVGGLEGNLQQLFGTSGSYTSLLATQYINGTQNQPSGSNDGGFGRLNTDPSITPNGGIIRGGYWRFGSDAGVFAVFLKNNAESDEPSLGISFRCVYHP